MAPTKTANTWTVDEINAILAVQSPRPQPYGALPTAGAEFATSTTWTVAECNANLAASIVPLDPQGRLILSGANEPYSARSTITDKAPPPRACAAFPSSNTLTNPRFLFLREIGGKTCLSTFLESVIQGGATGEHWGGTLIIDEEVSLSIPLRLPPFYTLSGTGINGAGRLKFLGGFDGPAVFFKDVKAGGGNIRDLAIEGPGLQNKAMGGIKIGSKNFVTDNEPTPPGRFRFHRVRVSGFGAFGMQGGTNTPSVDIDSCQVFGNRINIQLVRKCDKWRIRDCVIRDAAEWGVDIGATINVGGKDRLGSLTDVLVSGCLFSGNKSGAIQVQKGDKSPTLGVFIFGNGFENNGSGIAVRIEHTGAGVRMLANFLGLDEDFKLPDGEDLAMFMAPQRHNTHSGFNASKTLPLNLLKAPK